MEKSSPGGVFLSLFLLIAFLAACGSPAAEETAAQEEVVSPTAEPPSPTPIPPTLVPTLPPPATATPIPTTAADPADPAPSSTPLPPTPSPTPDTLINGVPLGELVVMDEETVAHMKEVFALGQTLGRNPYRFSKLGDSVIANGDFLTRFDFPDTYNLGPYADLAPVINHFSGSWDRYGVGIRIGLHAWGVFDPMWANKDWCEPNEVMIDCEFRLNNPAVVLIHLGTNDTTDSYPGFLRQTIEHALEGGVMPVILTKADRFEGDDNRNNETMRALAAEYHIPLVDFDRVADTLDNRGLKEDNVHLNGPLQHDYNLEETMQKGHTVHNLLVLFMLDEILDEVMRLDS